MTTTIQVGDTVRLTRKFLKNTGQQAGSEGISKWVVIGFAMGGAWAITNDPFHEPSYFTSEELAADPTLKYRRIAVDNLEKVKG